MKWPWQQQQQHQHCWHEIPDSHRKVRSLDKPKCALDGDSIYRRPLGGIVVKLDERCCLCKDLRSDITIEGNLTLGLSYPPLEETT